MFKGTGEGWVDSARATLQKETSSSHQVTNMLITVDGDRAASETYFIVSQHAEPSAETARTSLIRGRYVDQWSIRDGRWAIAHREIIIDFGTLDVSTGGNRVSAGRRDQTDPSYRFYQ